MALKIYCSRVGIDVYGRNNSIFFRCRGRGSRLQESAMKSSNSGIKLGYSVRNTGKFFYFFLTLNDPFPLNYFQPQIKRTTTQNGDTTINTSKLCAVLEMGLFSTSLLVCLILSILTGISVQNEPALSLASVGPS